MARFHTRANPDDVLGHSSHQSPRETPHLDLVPQHAVVIDRAMGRHRDPHTSPNRCATAAGGVPTADAARGAGSGGAVMVHQTRHRSKWLGCEYRCTLRRRLGGARCRVLLVGTDFGNATLKSREQQRDGKYIDYSTRTAPPTTATTAQSYTGRHTHTWEGIGV